VDRPTVESLTALNPDRLPAFHFLTRHKTSRRDALISRKPDVVLRFPVFWLRTAARHC
jgi:hypothetical protein